jgi:hypothetical protein
VIVYCRHARALGVVRRNPVGGFLEFRYRDARVRDSNAHAWVLDGRDSSGERLEGRTVQLVDSRACRDCGVRDLSIAALVDAFKEGLPKLAL